MASIVSEFIRKPQDLRSRWWIFQIHLWSGIIVSLYILIVGLSGSILVFREEVTALTHRKLMRAPGPKGPLTDIETVLRNVRAAYPTAKIQGIRLPALYSENFKVFIEDKEPQVVFADPVTGRPLGIGTRQEGWITWLQQLHFYLLMGKPGLIANGVGGVCLMLLCATGIIIWWPGIKNWTRSLLINFRAGWKRINWDLHSAVGFWTLIIVFFWGLTGAYFTWPQQYGEIVNRFSPVTNVLPKRGVVKPPAGLLAAPNLAAIVEKAQAFYPETRFAGLDFPAKPTLPLTVYMAREELWNTRATNYLYFDPFRTEIVGHWERGVNRTAGDAIIFLMGPIHFGVYWGMTVKILWAVLGTALPLLAITGVLMYWNRSFGKIWRRWRKRSLHETRNSLQLKA